MTALPDLHPDSGHPVLVELDVLEETLGRLFSGVGTPLTSGDYGSVLTRLERDVRRLEALKLRVIAAADRAETAQRCGFTGTDAWVARSTTTARGAAAKSVGLAQDLTCGEHEETARALDAGTVSPEHAAVIVNASRRLPDGVTDHQRRTVETALVEKAARFNPDQLRREARRAIEAIEPDEQVVDAAEDALLRSEEAAAREACSLSMRDNGDGTTTGHFTVPTFAAAVLGKVIESMTAPRRMRTDAGRAASPEGPSGRFADWAHRRGLAFTTLLEHLPTEHLHHKTAATVVVTISHDVLQGALKAAGLDTGGSISAGEARRLACNAGILPAVLGTGSVALDLGYANRLFNEAQRVAVGLEHQTCVAEGCERPYAWCELHHLVAWALGGRTDLRNAIPLCNWHHQRIHDPHYHHQLLPDGDIRFRRLT